MSLYVIKLLLGGESEFMEKKTPYSDRSKTEKCISAAVVASLHQSRQRGYFIGLQDGYLKDCMSICTGNPNTLHRVLNYSSKTYIKMCREISIIQCISLGTF